MRIQSDFGAVLKHRPHVFEHWVGLETSLSCLNVMPIWQTLIKVHGAHERGQLRARGPRRPNMRSSSSRLKNKAVGRPCGQWCVS